MSTRSSSRFIFLLLFSIGFATTAPAQASARIVCFGDSITKRGYPAIVGELLGVESINAGVGGHTSGEGLRRMTADVLEKNPDVVVIFFGTNDIRVDNAKKHTPPAKYQANLEEMIAQCRKIDAKVVLCTLPPIKAEPFFQRHDQKVFDAAGGLSALIMAQQQAAIAAAKNHNVVLVDLQKILLTEPKWMSPDGVHPSDEGNTIIANHIAKAIEPLLAGRFK
ncbi:MAG: GDSL-type esterase/lipase family protein [Pirellulaceae bacterium]